MDSPSRVFGLLCINKPRGPTSHDIVALVRRGTGEHKIGHAGTLDPMAEGVLVLALGQATRLLEYLSASPKSYRACLALGVSTDTYDAEGVIVSRRAIPSLDVEQLETVLDDFRGSIDQVPPAYSAVKIKGKAAHARVRAGEDVHLAARRVEVVSLDIDTFEPPNLMLSISCSAGTYIRGLAHDLGEKLGCGATLTSLVRTASGHFHLPEAVSWENLRTSLAGGSWQDYVLPADLALPDAPRVVLDQEGMQRVRHGASLPAGDVRAGLGRAYTPFGQFVAVLSGDPQRRVWQPKKVFTDVIEHFCFSFLTSEEFKG